MRCSRDSLSRSDATDAKALAKANNGVSVVAVKMVKMGNLRQIFIELKATRKITPSETVNMFSLSGDARPLLGFAAASDAVVGYMPTSGNFWGSPKNTIDSGATFSLATSVYFAQ